MPAHNCSPASTATPAPVDFSKWATSRSTQDSGSCKHISSPRAPLRLGLCATLRSGHRSWNWVRRMVYAKYHPIGSTYLMGRKCCFQCPQNLWCSSWTAFQLAEFHLRNLYKKWESYKSWVSRNSRRFFTSLRLTRFGLKCIHVAKVWFKLDLNPICC